ncbi:MAG: hypothetical protein ACI4QN_01685 [Candidatus Coproplasma sp.]
MKRLKNNVKVFMIVAITALLTLIFLFVQNGKVYCVANAEHITSTEPNSDLFFSNVVQPRWFVQGERIYDSDENYKTMDLSTQSWNYNLDSGITAMPTRNEEIYFLYATDSTGSQIKLKPVTADTVWTNANAENNVTILFEQVVSPPSNVSFNDDSKRLNDGNLNEYFRVPTSSEKIDKGIILYRSDSSIASLQSNRWNYMKLCAGASLSFGAPAYVEIAVLYELREFSGFIVSHYSHCIASYFLWVAER